MAKEKAPKKNGSKKPDKPLLPMILSEIVKCYLVEYDTAGAPKLIYKKGIRFNDPRRMHALEY